MKLMVYSHDTYGLGNIRRMVAICEHLLASIPGLSILLVSGAPMLHSFRMPPGLDYIKLPCLRRDESGALAAPYLRTDMEATVRWRSETIRSAAANFHPDLLLVDKKPHGIQGELHATLDWLEAESPATKIVLLLRDILDSPSTTMHEWAKYNYLSTLESRYDKIWVVGDPTVFDLSREYHLPAAVAEKVEFCGYLRKPQSMTSPQTVRHQLNVAPTDRLMLVTPGGGADGFRMVSTFIDCLPSLLNQHPNLKSTVVCGPDMPAPHVQYIQQRIKAFEHVTFQVFTDDLMGYMEAADVVLSMAGYNTTCEILTLRKRAVIVPRMQPVQEQLIRADCLAKLGLVEAIHPDHLTPQRLAGKLHLMLSRGSSPPVDSILDLEGLVRLGDRLQALLPNCLSPMSAGLARSLTNSATAALTA